jgi:hypothetical protein
MRVAISRKPQLSRDHLPKLSLVQYICSFGGLSSMWFGISVLSTLNDLSSKLKYFLVIIYQKLLMKAKIFIGNCSQNTVRRIRFFKQLLNKSKLILLTILMFYQISTVLREYSNYETITRFEVNNKKV